VPLLLLDLDDTLIDRRAAFRAWAPAFAARHQLGDVVAWLEELDGHGYTPRATLFSTICERFVLSDSVDELLHRFHEEFARFTVPPSAASLDLMESLRKRRWRIGVVTNGSPSQINKIEAAGVMHLLDACCISELEGARKPEPAIFSIAAERCGASLAGGWMIGDHPDADIRGGHGVGLSTIWLTHGRDWTETSYRPNVIVDTLEEALQYVATAGNAAHGHVAAGPDAPWHDERERKAPGR
jgi:putative hydrolase of the HAD superfamily